MRRSLVTLFACSGIALAPAHAQFGRSVGDWMTSGADAQRSSWIRSDAKISKDVFAKPGFQFLWKVKLGGAALREPVLLNFYIGYRGFRSLGFMGGVNSISAVDTDLARIEWQKKFDAPQPSGGCAARLLTEVTRPTNVEIPSLNAAPQGFGGRGGPARSGVGSPGEGAVTLAAALAPPTSGAGRRPGPPPGYRPNVRRPIVLYALSSDGMLHTMYVSNGEEPDAPLKFLAPNAASSGLIVLDDVAYATVGEGCGAASGVFALNLETKQAASWTDAAVAGSAGAAVGPDSTLYVATGAGSSNTSSAIVALAPKTLEVKGWYTASEPFVSSPVVFEHKSKVLLAAATKDGRMHVVDASSPGGPDHKTALAVSAAAGEFKAGALASWEDRSGVRWLLAPTDRAIVAWKLADANGAPAVEQGWTSREMRSPGDPLIVNGVMFTISNASGRAILYALDGTTGKELWNSGDALPSKALGSGISVGGGQVYVTTSDGEMYAFGFWMEH